MSKAFSVMQYICSHYKQKYCAIVKPYAQFVIITADTADIGHSVL